MNTYFEVSPPVFVSVNRESKDLHPKVTSTGSPAPNQMVNRGFRN